MKIEYSDYVIKPSIGFAKFDLFKKRVTGKGKEWLDDMAYGVYLPRALEIVATELINKSLDTTDLETYIKEYKKLVEDLYGKFGLDSYLKK